MAKIGLLYLDHGVWQGEQVVPAEWVTRATTEHVPLEVGVEGFAPAGEVGYGYLWWTVNGSRAFTALGGEGQFVFVDPDTQTVIVKLSHGPVGPKFEDVQRETLSFLKAASRWQPGPKDPLTHGSTNTRK